MDLAGRLPLHPALDKVGPGGHRPCVVRQREASVLAKTLGEAQTKPQPCRCGATHGQHPPPVQWRLARAALPVPAK